MQGRVVYRSLLYMSVHTVVRRGEWIKLKSAMMASCCCLCDESQFGGLTGLLLAGGADVGVAIKTVLQRKSSRIVGDLYKQYMYQRKKKGPGEHRIL